jgi:TnpA family transposase
MKHFWTDEDLIEFFTLSADEHQLLANKSAPAKLGYAVLLKILQYEGRFPTAQNEVPKAVVKFIARQIDVSADELGNYKWKGRTTEYHRAQIRKLLGFKRWRTDYTKQVVDWLQTDVVPNQNGYEQLKDALLKNLRTLKIEPPKRIVLDRIIDSAVRRWEDAFFRHISERLPAKVKTELDLLLRGNVSEVDNQSHDTADHSILFRQLKAEPGNVSLDSIINEAVKLEAIRKIKLPADLFQGISAKTLKKYRNRVMTEPAREMRRHPSYIRYALFAIFLYLRSREITDGLVDLLIKVVHRIGARAEKKVVKEIIENVKKVSGKDVILYKMASAAWDHPDDPARETIFPVVGEQTIQDIIKEYKHSGSAYTLKVNTRMRASYRNYYRRMLPAILKALDIRSNNKNYRPIIDGIIVLKKYMRSQIRYYPKDEQIPIDGVVPNAWKALVLEIDGKGCERVNRIAYELCVFGALREKLRCKEVWVVGADRYRNPDEDLPDDFELKRAHYYAELGLPIDADAFITKLQEDMHNALETFNNNISKNANVDIITSKNKSRIKLTPLKAQSEPENLPRLKSAIKNQWNIVSLLDVLKEADLRINFTRRFKSVAQREVIDEPTLRKRLLLILYALGTNAGVKRILAGNHGEKYHDLIYVQRRFVHKEYLRQAIADVVNAILAARRPHIWGEATTACASDSKQFGAWDQNLLTEWHARYGGRGVMIYWHVEKGASCIYSQLKSCSSSEVAAMIEGVIRHCTEMTVTKQYVDSHGQSYVAFAFCHLLGFKLLPRFKSIHSKKLYRPYTGKPDAYDNLQPILTRPINWDLIRRQYDQMVKFTTAIRLGTAETESILRRFTRENLKHPTYQALIELGKAMRTIFLCNYLDSKHLRREIQEGLNVVELWNNVNDFIFFGKGGDFATNKKESQELTVLSLHLLQNCLVYINTLMIQQTLNDPEQMEYMTPEDMRGLTPLFFSHINPYGSFDLDMGTRLPIVSVYEEAA